MLRTPSGDPLPRVISANDARRLGYTEAHVRTELRHGRWDRLVLGIYLTRGDLPARSDWIRAGLLIAGPGAVLSGWDAVRTYGLGSERPPTPEVLVLAAAGTHRVSGQVRIRPSRRIVRPRRFYLPDAGPVLVPSAARAVADTALVYRTLAPVRALVTSCMQAGHCTTEELRDELEDGPRNGSAHLRQAINDVLAGAASIAEAELADLLQIAGLPPFELNVPIIDPSGRHIATADVLWRSLRAILEVDSRKHHFREPDWKQTMRRHNLLSTYGLALTH